jgi:hypothetical protein
VRARTRAGLGARTRTHGATGARTVKRTWREKEWTAGGGRVRTLRCTRRYLPTSRARSPTSS